PPDPTHRGPSDMRVWRKSTARQAVMDKLSDGQWWYGLDLARECRIKAGLLWRVLDELEAEGLLATNWEEGPYPRRRLYALKGTPRQVVIHIDLHIAEKLAEYGAVTLTDDEERRL